jgi:hypothetical protein
MGSRLRVGMKERRGRVGSEKNGKAQRALGFSCVAFLPNQLCFSFLLFLASLAGSIPNLKKWWLYPKVKVSLFRIPAFSTQHD